MDPPERIIGIDEVGLGAWAGPLVVCAFSAPDELWKVPGLNDSKKLSKAKRDQLAKMLMRDYRGFFALIEVSSQDIDRDGIAVSLPWAMKTALNNLIMATGVPDRVIIDGENKGILGAEFYPRADGRFQAVMAASVIAKVYRDDKMAMFSKKYPEYGFEKHSGYGTSAHHSALIRVGLCPLHRRSYRPMKDGFIPLKEQQIAEK